MTEYYQNLQAQVSHLLRGKILGLGGILSARFIAWYTFASNMVNRIRHDRI